MRILLCGASGFIGRPIALALQAAGHEMVARSRRSRPALDFARATRAADWRAHLAGIDAVVNAVGVLRDSARAPMAAVHEAVPQALFDACAEAGVRRVLHISALGIEANPTRYARTKRAADEHLLRLNQAGRLDGLVLRPSLVFGPGGASSQLFVGLSQLPVLLLPRPVLRARVQPLAVAELAEAVAQLIAQPARRGLMELGGPEALTLADFIASLRAQRGAAPARTLPLPGWLTRLSARVGDAVPVSPWCSETLALLATDNVAAPGALAALLGRAPCPPGALLATLRGHDARTQAA
ncbi:NAD-dependent epimerase/dehydratase family protein [Xenophilus sp. Marseille-Q4582]|uniref:NAD-dependent epimerase/dehydratase family protein n=1 Tax=Xenophilus sp. Marseille-Q4582 TaxID=2866600 RepID=UPI001CE3EE24|nr:NAD-dependent epimerase/dehydratase family protein [Xenophilus sp. Marseille-Q4582]